LVDACRKVEITKPTFYSYLDKYDLRSKYEAAKITIIDDAHDTIARAVKVDPKYALEVLKRRRSKQW